jgi:hypothetical protein
MFYVAKVIEAFGIIFIAANFIIAFPELMNFKMFLAGGVIFLCGWAIERYGVKK